ncbi:MAG: type II toxin-antitoxin system Phd/YefM family antitoxin [Pseudonocardiales bacterium]
MTALPLGDVRDRLSEVVSEVERTHHRVTITRHGHAAAVLIAPDDLAALEETIDILTTPGELAAIADGIDDADAGRFVDAEAIRAKFRK